MSNKTRKHIWPASAVMAMAIIGVLAAFIVLAANPGETQAHGAGDHPNQNWPACADMTPAQKAIHNSIHAQLGAHGTMEPCPPETPETPTRPAPGASDHATMPQAYWLEGLDNGARLSWDDPAKVHENADVVGYEISRDAWNSMASHPINTSGDAMFMVGVVTHHNDLGLAYRTVYTYKLRAVVEYDARGWWDNLLTSCGQRTAAVDPGENEPAATAGNYCEDYDDLSDAERLVVNRAYADLDPMAYTRKGQWTMDRTITTADSGGRLAALLDAPTAPQDLDLTRSCDDRITVTWRDPADFGTVPSVDDNGVYVGPDYIGGRRAGKEEVGEDATGVSYELQRAAYMGENGVPEWIDVTSSISARSYAQGPLMYGYTYLYRVRAMNDAGLYSPWVQISEFAREDDQPNMPTSLNVDPVNGTVELQWDPPSDTIGLWRTMADFNRAGDESGNLEYIIERKVGSGSWNRVPSTSAQPNPRPHMYADNFADTLTQAYTDNDPPVGKVSYRVAALVNDCNPSPWNQKDPVDVSPAPLGTVSDLAFQASAQQLNWTAPRSAVRQFAIVVNAADDTDYCLGTLDGDASTYICTRIANATGSVYVGLVIAQDANGNSTISNFPTHRVR